MRIILNLGNFFHDHRSLARVYVHEKMRIINDLVEHIQELFNIRNFYLQRDGQYLRPKLKLSVLAPDTVLEVVPFREIEIMLKKDALGPQLMTRKRSIQEQDVKLESKLAEENLRIPEIRPFEESPLIKIMKTV